MPILIVASILPQPYRLSPPASAASFAMFLVTSVLGLCVVASITALVYIFTFFSMSPSGIRIFVSSVAELLSGAVVPLPFFPEKIRKTAEFSPFAAVQNLPLRVYSGNIAGKEMLTMTAAQIFWLVFLVILGKVLMKKALRLATVQGG